MDQIDKITNYRQILQQVVEKHATMSGEPEDVESIPICDPVHDNYLLMDIGMGENGRTGYVVFHLRVKDGKVWIERDGIEYGIAQDLIDAGVAKEDIVLGFYGNEPKPLSELAAA